MKLNSYDKERLSMQRMKSDNWDVLRRFSESDMDCAQVTDFTQASAYICSTSLNASIKRFHFSMKAIVRKGEVFLVKL